MKLRTQFVFLIAGIIVVPFLVAAIVLLYNYQVALRQEPTPDFAQFRYWIHRDVPRAIKSGKLDDLGRSRPPGLDLFIVGKDNTIVYSTVPEVPAGISLVGGELMDYVRRNVRGFHFQIVAPHGGTKDDPLIILKMPRLRDDGEFRNQAIRVIMYSAIALLVFSSFMSYVILRSLNRSIVTLEGATRKIADGDLDFELPTRGNDEISSLTRSFDHMRKALKEEYARRARFIMGVSHDLKTPLALIQGYVEAIADGFAAEPEVQKKYLAIIQDKTQSLEGMVADLIEFVKMDTGEWRMTFRDVPVAAFFTNIARRYTEDALILKREFSHAIELPADLTVPMDESLVARALENLIGNAIRYTAEGGKVSLEVRAEGSGAVVSVTDTGIGIPQEEVTRIFDPFYRGTNSRREQGFGLGLTTVKSIIEGHGWSIDVKSQVGEGTSFIIHVRGRKAALAALPLGVTNGGAR